MATLPALPPGATLLSPDEAARVPRFDPAEVLRREGFTWTNGFRTDEDTARIRRQGYSPADDSRHLDADAVDLDHPRLSPAQQSARLQSLFGDWEGVRILDEGHHRHLQLPGWGAAPGTPGTPYSGLPPLPAGAELVQRGALTGRESPAAAPPPPAPPMGGGATGSAGAALEPDRRVPQADDNLRSGGEERAPFEQTDTGNSDHVTHTPPWKVELTEKVWNGGKAPDSRMIALWQGMGQLPKSEAEAPELFAAARARLAHARGAVASGKAHRWIPPDIAERPDPLPQQPGQSNEDYSREQLGDQGSITTHHPDLSERIGRFVGGLIGDDREGARAGSDAEDFLSDWTPVGGYDYYNEHREAQLRAEIEGRPLDAAGNQLGAAFGAATMIPIFQRGKAAAKVGEEIIEDAAANLTRSGGGRLTGMADFVPAERPPFAGAPGGPAPTHAPPVGDDIANQARAAAAGTPSPGFTPPIASSGPRVPKAPPRAGPAPEPPAAADTRGQGVFYHGARDEVPNLNEGYYNPANIYGGMDTFYTTDATDIARGYGRRRPNAKVYQVTEREPVNFYDMEEDQPAEFFNNLFGVGPDDLGLIPMSIDEAVTAGGGRANLRQVMDEIRDASAGEGVSRDEVQEQFEVAAYGLRERGFGGMTHIGGLKTGRSPHTVRIYFDAPSQLDLADVTPSQFAPRPEGGVPQSVAADPPPPIEPPRLRAHAIPQEAGTPLASFRVDLGPYGRPQNPGYYSAVTGHRRHGTAKAGDRASARELVVDLVPPENLEIASRELRGARFVPVIAEEARGRNAIPHALADHYADAAGGVVDTSIIQSVRAHHTSKNAADRMASRPLFEGPVVPGASYVIVDDVATMGGTVAALADHIQNGGGIVKRIVVLGDGTGGLAPAPEVLRSIEEKGLGDLVRQRFGIEPGALTAAEARYVDRFKSSDTFGKKFPAGVGGGGEQGLRGPAGGGESQELALGGLDRPRDYIDTDGLPPLPPGAKLIQEPKLGRARRTSEPASPDEVAAAARRVHPEDMRPIPGNQVETAEEAARANPGTIQNVTAPDPWAELRSRKIPVIGKHGRFWHHKGPIDAEAFLRRLGGLKDEGGSLTHIGLTNAPRPHNRGEARLGRLIDNENGLDLDDATYRLWEAGYFPDHVERPMIEDLIDLLQASRNGQRTFHPDDFDEVDRFENAMATKGMVETAEMEGKPLAERIGEPITREDMLGQEPPATAYEDLPKVGGKVANINLAHLETAKDVRRALQMTEVKAGGLDAARRGKISRAETEALARDLGMTADDLLTRRRGQALNAEQALAARQILARSLDEIVRMAAKIEGGSEEELAAFRRAWVRHLAIQEQVTGMTAEAGRALSQFNMAARSKDHRRRVLQAFIENAGGADNLEDVARGIIDLQRDPAKLNRFLLNANKPIWKDKLIELWYNSLLSGPQTHAVNSLSNTLTQFLQFPEHIAAAAIGAVRWRSFDRVMASEIGPRAVGMLQGAKEGVGAFKHTLKTGDVPDFVTKVESARQEAISGLKGKIIRIPTRLLSAEDEFFKATARRMEIAGLAVRHARGEGLKGEALARRIEELNANPTDEMMERALDYARYLTFQRPVGPVASKVMQLTQAAPILKLILPFVRTPTNLLKFAVERSPAAPLLREVRAGFKAGGARRDLAIARMTLGSGLGLLVTMWAADGHITGGGPADENAKRLLQADGWQPYSFKIGDTYYSYQRLDPLAMTLGIAADMVDLQSAMTERQRGKVGTLITASIIQNMANKTWLSGLADALQVIEDPERYGSSFTKRLAGSMAVPALLAQTARTIDPTLRQTSTEGFVSGIYDSIRSRTPFASSDLPPARDVWGAPIVREGGLGPDILSPIWMMKRRNDPVTKEMMAIGAVFGKLNRNVGGARLSDEDYNRYQDVAGRLTYQWLAEAIADPSWQEMSPADRKAEAATIKTQARAEARAELFDLDADESD